LGVTGKQQLFSDHLVICSLLLTLLTFYKGNWYFEMTKMVDQGISDYVYPDAHLKNARGSSSYLILSQH
jgi:hypothetical protein